MIISDSRKQVFCHIPKNGGSSLRFHFLTEWSDDAREYQGRREVPVLGEIRDLSHITVAEAGQWFDDDLIGQGYRVTAVVRAPGARFSSALLQYIRSFAAQDKHFVTGDTVRKIMARTSVEDLCARAATDISCIYFRPQVDFITGVPEAQHDLMAINQLSERFPGLPRDNKGGRLPKWMGFAKHPVVKRMAGSAGGKIKAQLSRKLIRKDPQIDAAIAEIMQDNDTFLRSFYAEDQALYTRLFTPT